MTINQTQPLLPRLPQNEVRAWPGHKDAPEIRYQPLGALLKGHYATDAHFVAYSIPEIPHRLDHGAVGHAKLPGGVPMKLLIFDIDSPAAHKEGKEAAPEWRMEEFRKVERLFAQSAGLAYDTRGGYRLVFQNATPFFIKDSESSSAWKRRYLRALCYLSRVFEIIGDPKCKDWQHLFRLPHATRDGGGRKPENRNKVGDPENIGTWTYQPTPQTLELDLEQAKHNVGLFPNWAKVPEDLIPPTPRPPSPQRAPSSLAPYLQSALNNALEKVRSAPPGDRNATLNKETFSVAGLGIDPELLREVFTDAGLDAGLSLEEVSATVESAIKAGATKPRTIPTPTPTRKPNTPKKEAQPPKDSDKETPPTRNDRDPRMPLCFQPDRLEEQAGICLRALAEKDTSVFQRSGALVSIRKGIAAPGWERDTALPLIAPIEPASLKGRISEAVFFYQITEKKQAKPLAVPHDIALVLLQKGAWNGIRPLAGISAIPFLRSSGTICQEPGYDAETGIMYMPRSEYPRVPDNPTRADAQASIALLRELICDFPFADNSHRSAALALFLTLAARFALTGPSPLFAADAPERGSGKTLLINVIAKAILGHLASVRPYPIGADDAEMKKVILSALLAGDPLVAFDNIPQHATVGGGSLEAVITSRVWKDRILGKSKDSPTLPNLAVWSLSGNNTAFTPDMIRRVLPIRIEPVDANPESRQGFTHPDLPQWVEENHPRLCTAALTVLRAFLASGTSYAGEQWGSFERWTSLIAGALVWVGEANPLDARNEVRERGRDEVSALSALLHAIRAFFPNHSFTAAELLDEKHTVLWSECHALAPGKDGKSTARTLAARFKKDKGRRVRVEKEILYLSLLAGKAHGGAPLWTVSAEPVPVSPTNHSASNQQQTSESDGGSGGSGGFESHCSIPAKRDYPPPPPPPTCDSINLQGVTKPPKPPEPPQESYPNREEGHENPPGGTSGAVVTEESKPVEAIKPAAGSPNPPRTPKDALQVAMAYKPDWFAAYGGWKQSEMMDRLERQLYDGRDPVAAWQEMRVWAESRYKDNTFRPKG